MTIELSSLDQLELLTAWRHSLVTPDGRTKLSVVGLSRRENDRLTETFDRYLGYCGCKEGKLGMLIGAATAAVLDLSNLFGNTVTAAIAMLFAGAVLGKLAGLARSHIQLKLAVAQARSIVRSAATAVS